MRARDKIRTAAESLSLCESLRRRQKRIVFTNGCFDLLHVGHVRYLEDAKDLGDFLIVALNTDLSVQAIKGPLRPVTPELQRAELVASLQCVDCVTFFDTLDPLPLITMLQPDVLVKGADWAPEKIIGADVVQRRGGEVVGIPLFPETSTTRIIERIVERFGKGSQLPGGCCSH